MRAKEIGMLGACLALCAVIAMINRSFLSPANFENLSRVIALLGLFAIGQAFVEGGAR